MEIEEHVPLVPYTTFHLGGPAKYFVRVRNVEELTCALDFARDRSLNIFILGGGSNVLIDDAGSDGLVLKIEINGITLSKESNVATFVVGAGESWDGLVVRAVAESLWGIENLSGIPGTVGGACVQNIGAYGAALSETLEWVEVFDIPRGEVVRLSNKECAFGYRDSIFKHTDGHYVVLRAAFRLSIQPKPNISYKDLNMRFADSVLDSSTIRNAVLEIRKGKFPDLSQEGTAGSFFKNPILPQIEAQKLREQYPKMPLFDLPESAGVKIPLAWLFDHALNLRDTSMGGARLFEKQLLVIATEKNATAHEVRELANTVQKVTKEKLSIDIEPEVKII